MKVLYRKHDGEIVESELERDPMYWGGWKVSYDKGNTCIILAERDIVDHKGFSGHIEDFNQEMEAHKERNRIFEQRKKRDMKKIYLAIPYSGIEEESFKLANQVTGAIMNRGDIPMSPISHSHPVAEECEVPGDWEFWKAMDFSFIDWADEVLVININDKLVKNSTGVQAEIKYAKETGKPVKYLEVIPDGDWYKFEV